MLHGGEDVCGSTPALRRGLIPSSNTKSSHALSRIACLAATAEVAAPGDDGAVAVSTLSVRNSSILHEIVLPAFSEIDFPINQPLSNDFFRGETRPRQGLGRPVKYEWKKESNV